MTQSDGPAVASTHTRHYAEKLETLRDLFGTPNVEVNKTSLRVDGRFYPIHDGVIILLPPHKYPPEMRDASAPVQGEYAPDIQQSFGAEWKAFLHVLPDHERDFYRYFDLVDLNTLHDKRVLDLGCGMGRWSHFLAPLCRELILVDFSEAIFVARRNLSNQSNTLFFMGDVLDLPFRDDAADFAFSLGVLHHTPVPALDAVRRLRRLAPRLCIYLYYALDNRPWHFRAIFKGVDVLRRRLCRVKNPRARAIVSLVGALGVYRPMVGLGWLLRPFGLSRQVPLYEGYHGKSLRFIQQDVYDRFFTSIEQRVKRTEIQGLHDTFSRVVVADTLPYWHFIVER